MSQHQFLLLGAYGQRNLGDDALLEVFLAQLGESRIIVNSAKPDETRRRYGVETIATYLSWPRLRRLRALIDSTAFVFGGGSLLKEVEGGPIARLVYFLRILLLLLAGKLLNRPTAMLGVGIGPLNRPLYRRLARLAASLTDLICVRDTASRDLLIAIGVKRPVYVTADPVFVLCRDTADTLPGMPENGPTVVVVPRYSLTDAQVSALASACDHLVELRGARIHFLAFQSGYQPRFDDVHAARRVQARMRHGDSAVIAAPETARAALDTISRAELVVSARLHALIFAAIQGVPAVALDYEVKVRSFMDEVGQAWATVSLPELEAGRIVPVLDETWERRHALGGALRERAGELQRRSQQSFEYFRALLRQPRGSGLLTGGALLLASMTIVNAGNYLSNLVLGRWLGPSAFADFSLMVTAFLIVTLITSTLQTISARFTAVAVAAGDEAQTRAVRAWLARWAWGIGGVTLATFALGAPLWQQFFQTETIWPFVILGVGLPFYYVQGIDRGALQGRTSFGRLSATYQVEMWVRLVAAPAFVALGWATNGAVAGITLSLVAAWAAAARAIDAPGWRRRRPAPALSRAQRRAILAFCGPVAAALVGQVMINNSDILIVKHFFPATAAGHYAALALIGRVVFFATISVVAAMFPIVAQKQQRGEPHRHLLWLALGIVAAASAVVIGATWALPELMVRILFGAAYLPIAPLLWLYAVATMLYALANVVINYRLSAGDGGGSALVVVAGIAQVAGLWLVHGSLYEVVVVQIILMVGLLAALLIWDWRLARGRMPPAAGQAPAAHARPLAAWPARLASRMLRRWRSLLLGGVTLAILLLMWQVAGAQPARVGNPAQEQLQQMMPALRASEAEQASGAYIPGVGAVITLDLLRGPNAWTDKPHDAGVRDWAIYLMGAFGPQLSAVPPDETIAISISYYEFKARVYHQLVITSRAADAANSATYAIWLDGQPLNEAARRRDAQPGSAAGSGAAARPAGASAGATRSFDDPLASAAEWKPVGGQWVFTDGGYAQTELGRYDLISLLDRPVSGDYTFQVDLKYLAGEMGGGIVFGAPDPASKNGAQMISYSEQGTYLQWGAFDSAGVFTFTGGSPVPSGADGAWHTLGVRVANGRYSISLDGALVVQDVPLAGSGEGRVGLLASTSHVIFDNLTLEAPAP